jgi:hypothetical protein
MNISRDDVTSKLLAGKNISEAIRSYPVNAVPGGLYQLLIANYSERGSIRNKRVESLSLGYFYPPWLKEKVKCIECIRDTATGASCFENHSKYTILALDLEIFRGDKDNEDCLYFWENLWLPAIKLCKDTGDYSIESLPPKLIARVLCRLFSEVMAIIKDTRNADLPMRHLLALCHDKQNSVSKKEQHDNALYNNIDRQTPKLQHINMIDGSIIGECANVAYGENKEKTDSNKNNNNHNNDKNNKNNNFDRYNNNDKYVRDRNYNGRDYRDGRDYERDRNKNEFKERNNNNRDNERDRQKDNREEKNKENKTLCMNHLANLLGVLKHQPCQYGKACHKYHVEKPKDFSNKKLYPTFVKEAKAILNTDAFQGNNKKDFKAAMLDELKHH